MGKRSLIAVVAGLALLLSAGAPAYADPGDNGNRPDSPPGLENKEANANGGNSGGNSGGGNAGGSGGPANDDRGKSSGPAQNAPNGNNGTVKVHDGPPSVHVTETDSEVSRSEGQVGCTFHIYGFHFDAEQEGTWEIVATSPTPDNDGASGSWEATDRGDYQSGAITLEDDGHYRLNFFTFDGHAKHKTFWVSGCDVSNEEEEEEEELENEEEEELENEESTGGVQSDVSGDESDRTIVAGVQTPPTTNPTGVAGQETAPSIAMLPSTSTAPDAPLALLGLLVSGAGAALLRTGRRS